MIIIGKSMLFRDDDDDDANKKNGLYGKKVKMKIKKEKKSITNQWLLKLNRMGGKKIFVPYLNLTLWLHIVRFPFSSNILLLNRLIAVSWL